jgi:hypothetical protein
MMLFMGLHAGNFNNPYINAFEPGSLVVGGFIDYLGLLQPVDGLYTSRIIGSIEGQQWSSQIRWPDNPAQIDI